MSSYITENLGKRINSAHPIRIQRLKHYAKYAGVSEPFAQRLRDEFFTKSMLSPEKITGLKLIMKDASEVVTAQGQRSGQIPSSGSPWKSFFTR